MDPLPVARAIVKYVLDALEDDREKLAETVAAMMTEWQKVEVERAERS